MGAQFGTILWLTSRIPVIPKHIPVVQAMVLGNGVRCSSKDSSQMLAYCVCMCVDLNDLHEMLLLIEQGGHSARLGILCRAWKHSVAGMQLTALPSQGHSDGILIASVGVGWGVHFDLS